MKEISVTVLVGIPGTVGSIALANAFASGGPDDPSPPEKIKDYNSPERIGIDDDNPNAKYAGHGINNRQRSWLEATYGLPSDKYSKV
ncbi:MAG: hypothetical protein WCK90_03990 [archaeon]